MPRAIWINLVFASLALYVTSVAALLAADRRGGFSAGAVWGENWKETGGSGERSAGIALEAVAGRLILRLDDFDSCYPNNEERVDRESMPFRRIEWSDRRAQQGFLPFTDPATRDLAGPATWADERFELSSHSRTRYRALILTPPGVMLLTGILPGVSCVALCVRGTRRRENACDRCGYDLRATPHRCPECGKGAGRSASARGPNAPGGTCGTTGSGTMSDMEFSK